MYLHTSNKGTSVGRVTMPFAHGERRAGLMQPEIVELVENAQITQRNDLNL